MESPCFCIYGSHGYIGTELYDYLKERYLYVIGISRREIDLEKPFSRDDVLKQFMAKFPAIFSTTSLADFPIVFVNCAAVANTSSKSTFDIIQNVSILTNELRIVEKDDMFIQISSCYSIVNSPYGNSKRICDDIIESFKECRTHSLKINYPFGAIKTLPRNGMIGKIYRNEHLNLFEEALRNPSVFCYIGDILKMVEKIANKEIDKQIVMCPGYEMTLGDFIQFYEMNNGTLFKTITKNKDFKPVKIRYNINWYGIEQTPFEKMFFNQFL